MGGNKQQGEENADIQCAEQWGFPPPRALRKPPDNQQQEEPCR
jgi:hypothetical protein